MKPAFWILIAGLWASQQTILPVTAQVPVPADKFLIEDVLFFGNQSTRPYVFTDFLLVKQGQIVDAAELDSVLKKSVDNLYDMRIFSKVNVQTKPGSAENTRIIIFTIVERPRWYYTYPIFFQDVYGLVYGQRTLLLNLMGRGGETRISLLGGGFREAEVDFFFPAILGTSRLFGRMNFYYNGFDYVFKDDPDQKPYPGDFNVHRFGSFGEFGVNLTQRFRVGTKFGYEQNRIGETGVTVNGSKRDFHGIAGLFIEHEMRDYKYFALAGTYYRIGHNFYRYENIRYQEAYFDFRQYFPVTENGSLAFQVFYDVLIGEIPVYSRFHIGGSRTIRGYERKSLDGESIGYISSEYRFPLGYKRSRYAPVNIGLAGHFFVDYGDAWYDNRSIPYKDFELSAGVGIQLIARRNSARLETGWARHVGLFIKAGSRVKF